MSKRKILYLITGSVLCLSFLGNVLFFLADGLTFLRIREFRKKNLAVFEQIHSIEEFRKQVALVNLELLLSGKRPEAPHFAMDVKNRIISNLNSFKKRKPSFYWGEPNWMLQASVEDALLHKDTATIRVVENLFRDYIENQEIDHVDQCLGGSVAILLNKYTGEQKYKDFADKMLRWCQDHDTEYGILYISDGDAQLIDGYGMYLPFLNHYAEAYNDSSAQVLADKQVELAARYLIDPVGGLPCHGYSLPEPHIKQGSCNFGRGLSWFLSGLVNYNRSGLSEEAKAVLKKMDEALMSVWLRDGQFAQFVGEESAMDLSANLPIIYYLAKVGKLKLTNDQILDFSRYSDCGLLYHSSGSTQGKYGYSQMAGPNLLSQAFMLKLINLF